MGSDEELREGLRDILFCAAGGITDMGDSEIDAILALVASHGKNLKPTNSCKSSSTAPAANDEEVEELNRRMSIILMDYAVYYCPKGSIDEQLEVMREAEKYMNAWRDAAVKQAEKAAELRGRIDELSDLWTGGSSLHADIRCDYNRGLTVHQRIDELRAQLKNINSKGETG